MHSGCAYCIHTIGFVRVLLVCNTVYCINGLSSPLDFFLAYLSWEPDYNGQLTRDLCCIFYIIDEGLCVNGDFMSQVTSATQQRCPFERADLRMIVACL